MGCIREEPINDVDNGCRFLSNIDNLVSQSALVNLSEYRKIENIWANALNNGQKVSVDIKVIYDGDHIRPSGFIIQYAVDGVKTKRYIKN